MNIGNFNSFVIFGIKHKNIKIHKNAKTPSRKTGQVNRQVIKKEDISKDVAKLLPVYHVYKAASLRWKKKSACQRKENKFFNYNFGRSLYQKLVF